MGQMSSNLMKKVYGSNDNSSSKQLSQEAKRNMLAKWGGNPFVFTRSSTLYIDEDGQVAHEFYEEMMDDNIDSFKRCGRMKRVNHNIRPVGIVKLPHPSLNFDFPVVICEAPQDLVIR